MKFNIFTLFFALLLMVTAVLAVAQPEKSVIVTYPPETPNYLISDAKEAIIKAGGIITHEYTLLKGFAATCSVKALEAVKAMGEKFPPMVEEDQIVTAVGDGLKA
ncbi:MAG: hypothetical protein M1834_001943 [Cirrosporium novae-zelandiae]|nr:MAG: hypothetical protein M1834_001943 [Cirrosporium novae-zelandiae]